MWMTIARSTPFEDLLPRFGVGVRGSSAENQEDGAKHASQIDSGEDCHVAISFTTLGCLRSMSRHSVGRFTVWTIISSQAPIKS